MPLGLKDESVAAFVIVLVLVTAVMGGVSWSGGASAAPTGSTTTTTQTISCPALNSTQTSGGSNAFVPDFGPLLGNLSALSFVENVYGSSGNMVLTADLLVLNRSLTSSRPVFLVNVTVKAVSSSLTTMTSNGLTTTSTIPGSQTLKGSMLGLVASDGSVISVGRSIGDPALTSELAISPFTFFVTLVSLNGFASSFGLHLVNNAFVTIGSTRMLVSNYALPTVVLTELLVGCGPEPLSAAVVETVSDAAIQAGRVPGTDLTLITRFSEKVAFQSNSTSSSSLPAGSVTEEVTSFSVG